MDGTSMKQFKPYNLQDKFVLNLVMSDCDDDWGEIFLTRWNLEEGQYKKKEVALSQNWASEWIW